MWSIEAVPASCRELRELIDELSTVLAERFGSTGRSSFDPDGADRSATFVVGRWDGAPVACGALRPIAPNVGEVKRMYSKHPGAGRRVHAALEVAAVDAGLAELWLETRRANVAAIAFYRAIGYTERPPYGRYVDRPEAICLSKRLVVPGAG